MSAASDLLISKNLLKTKLSPGNTSCDDTEWERGELCTNSGRGVSIVPQGIVVRFTWVKTNMTFF